MTKLESYQLEGSFNATQFYADIAHEIRNPLHTLMASLDMARLEQIPAEKRVQYLENARHQTDRLSRLFNDLLTLQRFDADAAPVGRVTRLEYRSHTAPRSTLPTSM
jgi:signal transduction histidine kinase